MPPVPAARGCLFLWKPDSAPPARRRTTHATDPSRVRADVTRRTGEMWRRQRFEPPVSARSGGGGGRCVTAPPCHGNRAPARRPARHPVPAGSGTRGCRRPAGCGGGAGRQPLPGWDIPPPQSPCPFRRPGRGLRWGVTAGVVRERCDTRGAGGVSVTPRRCRLGRAEGRAVLIASQLWVAAEEETRVSVLTVTVPGSGRRAGRRRRRGTAGRFAWGEQMKAGKLFEVCSV